MTDAHHPTVAAALPGSNVYIPEILTVFLAAAAHEAAKRHVIEGRLAHEAAAPASSDPYAVMFDPPRIDADTLSARLDYAYAKWAACERAAADLAGLERAYNDRRIYDELVAEERGLIRLDRGIA